MCGIRVNAGLLSANYNRDIFPAENSELMEGGRRSYPVVLLKFVFIPLLLPYSQLYSAKVSSLVTRREITNSHYFHPNLPGVRGHPNLRTTRYMRLNASPYDLIALVC